MKRFPITKAQFVEFWSGKADNQPSSSSRSLTCPIARALNYYTGFQWSVNLKWAKVLNGPNNKIDAANKIDTVMLPVWAEDKLRIFDSRY